MAIRTIRRQLPGEVIDVAAWAADEDFPIYPIGSKPKRLVICPDDATPSFLKSGQGYLFKQATGWQAQQMWCEVIAYELSFILDVAVPPAFVAIDSASGQVGALLELFYPYPYPAGSQSRRLVHAADFMQKNFADGKKGRPHALRENLQICRALSAPDPLRWWARTIIFDTLIGNTDRHSENWGFLIDGTLEARQFSIAPLYDNGTSLGYGTTESKLAKPWDARQMAAYLSRGHHDIGWSRIEDGPTPHLQLCVRFFTSNPELMDIAAAMLAFTDAHVKAIVDWAETFFVPIMFTSDRARFVLNQLCARRNALNKALGL